MTREAKGRGRTLDRSVPSWALGALIVTMAGCSDRTRIVDVPDEGPVQPRPEGDPEDPPPTGPARIYLASADGSDVTLLTDGERPAWSPDGRRITFQRVSEAPQPARERARKGEIYVIDADGSDEALLGPGIEPAWSPDGKHIAFTDGEGIGVMPVDDSDAETLIHHDFLDDTYAPLDLGVGKPAWSPDGERIAFEHRGDGDIRPAQIYVMNGDGSDPRRLTPTTGRQYAESDPAWSPDGSRMALWSFGFGIATVDAEGGAPATVYLDFPTVAYGAKPDWSPDGRRIAFTAHRFEPEGQSVWVVEADGGPAEVLLPGAYDATWSPDGSQIAFASRRREARVFVYHGGADHSEYTPTSRYVLYDDGDFALQYASSGAEHRGTWTESGGVIDFDWEGGPWDAKGTLDGDLMFVAYDIVMGLSDFENAIYVRR